MPCFNQFIQVGFSHSVRSRSSLSCAPLPKNLFHLLVFFLRFRPKKQEEETTRTTRTKKKKKKKRLFPTLRHSHQWRWRKPPHCSSYSTCRERERVICNVSSLLGRRFLPCDQSFMKRKCSERRNRCAGCVRIRENGFLKEEIH